jgi:hypothetical protein
VSGKNQDWAKFSAESHTWGIYVSMAAQIVTDVLISVPSVIIIRKQRGGYEKTHTIMRKVLALTLGACLVPTVFAFVRLLVVSTLRSTQELPTDIRI